MNTVYDHEELSPEQEIFHPRFGVGEVVFRAQNSSNVYRCVFNDDEGDPIYTWCNYRDIQVIET